MHVLALNDQANFTFVELSVFTLVFLVKQQGEDFTLRSEEGAKNLDPALSTVETVHLGLFGNKPRGLQGAAENLVAVLRILHAMCLG